jgi:GntR family transcriptional regulator
MTTNSDPRLPRYQLVRDDLAGQINRRELLPGDAIPSEAELSAHYGVAVGTVRKAIDRLVADGVLDRQQGRGTFVRRARFNSSLFRFFRFQSKSGERRVPQSRITGRKSLAASSAVASALQIPVGEPVISLSRLRLIDDVPLLAEEIWLQRSRFEPILGIDIGDFGALLYPLYDEKCGQVVVAADETITVEPASGTQARLLGLDAGAPMVVIERLAFDLERRPIEWRRSRGPATKFRYHVEIR